MFISKLLAATMIAGAPADANPSKSKKICQRALARLGSASPQSSSTERIPSCASISSNPRLTSSSGMRCEMNGSTSISPAM